MIYILAPLLLATFVTRTINRKKLSQKQTLDEQKVIDHIFHQLTNTIDLEDEEQEKNV